MFLLELAKVTAISLNLNVNFDRKILSGSAELTVKKVDKTVKEIASKFNP